VEFGFVVSFGWQAKDGAGRFLWIVYAAISISSSYRSNYLRFQVFASSSHPAKQTQLQ